MIRLETPRLILRGLIQSDADAFSVYNQSEAYCRYRDPSPSPEAMREKVAQRVAQNNLIPGDYLWAIVLTENGDVTGDLRIRFKTEPTDDRSGIAWIGYGLNPDYWGQGLASEAVKAATDYAHRELNLHRIEAQTHPVNTGSWRVLEKCGYVREGVRRYRHYINGTWWPETYEYASIRRELVKDT